ncbi:hypothetical protein FNV43_RR14390 [Rhamnella rubrinervis]|uniref:Senescence-associated carboxylesterase 101 n=1 Tax=Rhamnella rubrinervis TaxID=2594499 RepID=A0A8K0MGA3_9ROSA|nr:hypothetical protein FNV43_RR14390 [Rhamnella rubrinervis]
MFKFSSGSEVANLLVASNILQQSCTANSKLYQGTDPNKLLKYQISQHGNYSILAFVASSSTLEGGQLAADLVSSSTLKDTFPLFDFQFLCSIRNPSFSINKATASLFESYHQQLFELKTQLSEDIIKRIEEKERKKKAGKKEEEKEKEEEKDWLLIITGHSLGGSIASLFTLWMLDGIDLSKTKPPLCITFGSPLIGDISLHNAINQYPTWNSCFLHVVSNQDTTPRIFIPHDYKPFGTFLICSESGCACFEDPESILQLLNVTASHDAQIRDPDHYKRVVDDLYNRTVCRDVTVLVKWITEPFESGIKRQLQALGVDQPEIANFMKSWHWQKHINYLKEQERKFIYGKKSSFEPTKKLIAMKIYMTYLEFYKKWCKDEEVGYYDMYKNNQLECDIEVEVYRKKLTNYWIDLVRKVEKKPQREGAVLRTRWLYGGTYYRWMVEPLDIADYYRDKKTNYESQGRSWHYKRLEDWLKQDQQLKEEERVKKGEEPKTNSIDSRRENAASILTHDSQFWAKLEEVKLLKLDEPQVEEKLKDFENHVWGLLKDYAVSPEIFLRESSFMKWWGDYKKTKGSSNISPLWNFMKNGEHIQYAREYWCSSEPPGCSKVANLLVASDRLQQPWTENSKLYKAIDPNGLLEYRISQHGKYSVLAFVASPSILEGCACFEEPESILQLLDVTVSHDAQIQYPDHYNQVLDDLYHRTLYRDVTVLVKWITEPFKSGIKRQLQAIGVDQPEVEESIILSNLKTKQDSQVEEKLDFEKHAWGLLNNYQVSPEIFLRESSFMKWWNVYKEKLGSSCTSSLYNFMKNGEYTQYETGSWSPLCAE